MASRKAKNDRAPKRLFKREGEPIRFRRDRGPKLPPGADVLIDSPDHEKMSEILEDFVEPYREDAPTEVSDFMLSNLADLGQAYAEVGRQAEAESVFDAAIKLGEEVARDHPGDYHGRMILANTLGDRGGLVSRLGRPDAARGDLRRSLDLAESLIRERPKDSKAREALSHAQSSLGMLEFVGEKFGESATWREKAVATLDDILRDDPQSVLHRRSQVSSLSNLGSSYLRVCDLTRAEATLRRSVEISRGLCREHPSVADYAQALASGLTNLSVVLTRTGQWNLAEEANLDAIAVQERMAREYPEMIAYQVALGSAYGNEGNFWLDRKEHARALPWFERSTAVMGEILGRQPRDVLARRVLRNSAWGQADALIALGRISEALPAWDRGIAAAEGTASLEMRLGRATSLARTGSTDRALAEAEAVLADPLASKPNGGFLWAVASRVPAAIAGQSRQGEPSRPQAGRLGFDEMADRAVDWLRRAEATGFFRKNPHRIAEYRNDPLLAVFGSHPDFRGLMLDLTFPAEPFAR